MSFVTPLFFLGMLAAGIPIFLHLIKRERADASRDRQTHTTALTWLI